MLNSVLLLFTAFLGRASAAGVTGAAEGFAKGVTGGGSASPVYPSTNAELVSCKYTFFIPASKSQHFLVQRPENSSLGVLNSPLMPIRPWRLFGTCDHPHKDL